MLDAISDFWKPSRRQADAEETVDVAALKVGASVGFGFMPQQMLSGKRRAVSAINTYQFGEESLTSYVLSEQADHSITMIVADGGSDEPYLAISRRLQFSERMRMFDNAELLALIENADQKRLNVRDADSEWRQWLVPQYKKEIHGLKGRLVRGDYRTFNTLPADTEVQEFTYFFLVSPNNEFAVEVEMYNDSRIELFATVYRRLSDIGEIRDPRDSEPTLPGLLPQGKDLSQRPEPRLVVKESPQPAAAESPKAEPISATGVVKEHVTSSPLPVAELDAKKLVAPTPVDAVFTMLNPAPVMDKVLGSFPGTPAPARPSSTPHPTTEKKPMTFATFNPQLASTALKSEVKTMNGHTQEYENDSIECELRAANKIIEEAIRNEMRMSDVIRRVIGLPLAGQESVQIPVLLSEDDYKLLAIRYGISPNDKPTIKTRIIEEVSDFAGAKPQ